MPDQNALIKKTREFVKKAFQDNPHYSFNHWSVMYNHSVNVQKLALKIADEIHCDKAVVAISALLHDIGKTYQADEMTLHHKHENFNLTMAEGFLNQLGLPDNTLRAIRENISYQSNSTEMKVVDDADALAFYQDKTLHMLWIAWASERQMEADIEKKLNKYERLNFDISRRLGNPWLEQTKKDWEAYRNT